MKKLLSMAIGTLMISFVAGSAWAVEFTSPVDVHTGPGESYPVVAQIPAGAKV